MRCAEKHPHTPTPHAPPLPCTHHRATPNPSPTFTLACGLHTFSATRILALRDRGFFSCSKAAGVCGRCVSTLTTSFAPHAHTGKLGGHVHSPSSRRNARFTMRSSSE